MYPSRIKQQLEMNTNWSRHDIKLAAQPWGNQSIKGQW